MKRFIHLLLLLMPPFVANGQQIVLDYDSTRRPPDSKLVKRTSDADVSAFDPAASIRILVNNFPDTPVISTSFNNEPARKVNSSPTGEFAIPGLADADIKNYRSYSILINCGGETATYQDVAKPGGVGDTSVGGNAGTFPAETAQQAIGLFFRRLDNTEFGLQIPQGSPVDPNYQYTGPGYTHIFLDQLGNSIVGVIPQGISNRQYVVHILYLTDKANPNQLFYSVKQTKGTFSTSLVFNNAGQLGDISTQGSSGSPVSYTWKHTEYVLRTSTDQIEFEVYKNILGNAGPSSFTSSLVSTSTIEMARVYHGSFDIGLLSSFLSNPTYELVPSAADENKSVVKQSDEGNRGIMTAMATFYTSPIILLEKLFGVQGIPTYKLTGRSFLDDHKLYERIFPAIGLSITEKAFKNLFYGLNWEVARGASVFGGFHYGEVTVFDRPAGFKFGETVVSDADFVIRTGKRWKNDFAFGANLDVTIISNLFRK